MAKGDFKKAQGVLPWKEGDELSEHVIRRHRDGGEDMGTYYYRKWVNAQATADRRGELLKRLIDSGMLTTNEKLMCQEECEDCDLTREILKELGDANS